MHDANGITRRADEIQPDKASFNDCIVAAGLVAAQLAAPEDLVMAQPQKKTTFHTGKTFGELSFKDKLRFIGKAAVFFASGGFVFPTMWID